MTRTTQRVFPVLVALSVLALTAGIALAKTAKKQNLVDLLSHSETIVVGTVTDKTDGFQNGLPYTEITLRVARTLKGEHASTYTFRQFGLMAPRVTDDGRVNLMVTPEGWPTYAKGENVVLFLHPAAARTGLRTTAGLSQGKFTIRDGRIVNGDDNHALFEGVRIDTSLQPAQRDLLASRSGPVPSADFLELVKSAVDERWIEKGVMTHDNQ